MKYPRLLKILLLVALLPVLGANDGGFIRVDPATIDFGPYLPNGPSIVLLAGDPEQEGFYLLRARFAPGVISGPHYHSTDRHVTVISGTWFTGTGREFNRDSMVPMEPGSYMYHPAGGIHYDGSQGGEVVLEIKGIGPVETVRFNE